MLQTCRYLQIVWVSPKPSQMTAAPKPWIQRQRWDVPMLARPGNSHHRNGRPRLRPCQCPSTQKWPRHRAIGLIVAFDPQSGESRLWLTAALPEKNFMEPTDQGCSTWNTRGNSDRGSWSKGPACVVALSEYQDWPTIIPRGIPHASENRVNSSTNWQ